MCVGMSAIPSPWTRTSKNQAGRRSGAPLTVFSRWWTLAISMAGERHDLTRPLRQQALERAAAAADDRPPGGRPRGPAVERVDQGQEVVHLRSLRGIDEDLLAHAGIALA